MQTRIESITENILNTGSGFVVGWILAMTVLPMFGFVQITASNGFWITVIYTCVSLVRGYLWRRYFNWRTVKKYRREK